jgi:dipeptidyl aminopeptidase/acylaminoacyl peptidase
MMSVPTQQAWFGGIQMESNTYLEMDRWRVFWTILMVMLLAVPLTWALEVSFSIDDVLASPMPSSLIAAESGQRIAWVFTLRGVANVWAAEGPKFEARQLTGFATDDGRPLRILGFSPDTEWIFIAKSSRFNPDSRAMGNGPSKLYRVAWTGGRPEELAEASSAAVSPVEAKLAFVKEDGEIWIVESGKEAEMVVSTRGALSQPSWSPDGKKLLTNSVRGVFPHRYSFVMVYDFEANAIRYIDPAVYFDARPVWSPDGTKIAFMRRLTAGHYSGLTTKDVFVPDPWEIRVADVATGDTIRVWRSPGSDSTYFADLEWFDDSKLVFRSEQDGWRHLWHFAWLSSGERCMRPAIETTSTAVISGRWMPAAKWWRRPKALRSSGRRCRWPKADTWPTSAQPRRPRLTSLCVRSPTANRKKSLPTRCPSPSHRANLSSHSRLSSSRSIACRSMANSSCPQRATRAADRR